ncbi:MAG: Snf7 family protein [Candidatus Bathyarchaeia archaeon]
MKTQRKKLEDHWERLRGYDRTLMDRCVKARLAHDDSRAIIYANECAEVRKIAKLTLASQLALEKAILRLETVKEFGDLASAMNNIPQVIQMIRAQIAGIMPETSYELNDICATLEEIALQTGETYIATSLQPSTEEAQTILKEANIIAEQEVKERFPELPVQSLEAEQENTG